MRLTANAARDLACQDCRQWILRSFISSIGGAQVHRSHQPGVSTTKHFSTSSRTRFLNTRRLLQNDSFPLNDINKFNAQIVKDRQRRDGTTQKIEESVGAQAVVANVSAEAGVHDEGTAGSTSYLKDGDEPSRVYARGIHSAMVDLNLVDTWEEVVTLWQEDRIDDAEHLLGLIREELRSMKSRARREKAALIQRAVDGKANEVIPRLVDAMEQEEWAEEEDLGEKSEHSEASELEASPTEDALPWYLQAQHQPGTQESPRAARQKLPDLPVHSPSILEPLLQYVSIELGMDDLSLLDLRSLDPPPALGANLLMLIGTARSEKHLHVSADRLCRYLRTTHRLSPYADGLLGRNELKLRLKRKAKRSRLLSAVGAKSTASGELDDGIRTGWVCVNVGRVEGGELPESAEMVPRQEGFVGFGARSEGARIVVQLLTDEKRGEVDLERLWIGIMKRAEREKAQEEGGKAGSGKVEEGGSLSLENASRREEAANAA